MSSTFNPQPELPNSDELVAYLDGELPPEECRAVEDRLATDEAYRQQLHDLDLAWEALSALPPATVDDSFARTTIELACVAAEDDLSQRKTLADVENRSHAHRWIAAGVAAAVVGFLIVRVLATHHTNALLADLPVIQQSNTLSQIESIDFLRQLSKAVPAEDFVKDDAVFQHDLADFNSANSASLGARREWVDSLSPDQKANLAERARAFEDSQQSPGERNRLRELANDVSREPDLEKTLVAYGLWIGRHSGGEQEQLRETVRGLPTAEHVAEIEKMVREENDQAARHLKPDDEAKLRTEIFRLASEKKAELQKSPPRRGGGEWIAHSDPSQPGPAIFILLTAIQNSEDGHAIMDAMVSKLSPEAQEQWKKMNHGKRERWIQLRQWVHDAMKPKYVPEDIEQFFVSDALSPDERQRLLEMPRAELKIELERLYLGSKEGVDYRSPLWREFGEGDRGPRNGPGDFDMGRPDPSRPGDRPHSFQQGPPDPRFGPDGPPRDQRFDPDRRPGPDGPRGMRPEDRPDNGRPGRRPRRPPEDDGPPRNGPPPNGPPPGDEPPPDQR